MHTHTHRLLLAWLCVCAFFFQLRQLHCAFPIRLWLLQAIPLCTPYTLYTPYTLCTPHTLCTPFGNAYMLYKRQNKQCTMQQQQQQQGVLGAARQCVGAAQGTLISAVRMIKACAIFILCACEKYTHSMAKRTRRR